MQMTQPPELGNAVGNCHLTWPEVHGHVARFQ